MSPASSGALEVERYIGACLISSQTRSKGGPTKPHGRDAFFQRDHYLPRYVNNNQHHHLQRCRSVDGWAGGMPLISFANYQRRGKAPQDARVQDHHNPLSRLAVHTQGAPLILTSRYNHRKNKTATRNFVQTRGSEGGSAKPKDAQGVDTVSVNSDESSASTNSENSLPRIIKPRKRRKKDRKPPHLARPLGADDCFSTDSASPDIDSSPGVITISPYLPFTFEQYHYTPPDNLGVHIHNNNNLPMNKAKVSKSDLQETPKLHHAFEDVEELSKDINDNQTASSCQCRYCDPSGQIWDVDRHCYSPFLTTPERQSTFSFPDIQVEPLVRGYGASLIECMTSLSLDPERIKSDSSILGSSRDLEVSTEIVTSLNGHRDLEIKFFSSSTDNAKKSTSRSLSLEEYRSRSDSVVINNKFSSLDLEQ